MRPLHRLISQMVLAIFQHFKFSAAVVDPTEGEASGDSDIVALDLYINNSSQGLNSKDGTTAFVVFTRAYPEELGKVGDPSDRSDLTTPRDDETDIIPIVGAVCGVTGLLVGIAISAAVWLYITKRKMHQRRTTISKNPEEKTFERLDFNLTLPRQQTADNSPRSIHESLPDSGYLHFEEPTPYVDDMCQSVEHGSDVQIRCQTPISAANSQGDGPQSDQYADDSVFGYPEHFLRPTTRTQPPGDVKYVGLPRTKYQSNLSFGALLHKDSSDQSTISKRSSSTVGIERRSSVCTCRTDLPDSDGSNCSTCGGSVSLTSSLAREKPHTTLTGYREHIQDFLSFIPVEETAFTNTSSTHFQDSAECSEIVSRPINELTSLSSSDSFIPNHEKDWDDEESAAEGETSLKYFDLELPPATFASPKKPARTFKQSATKAVKDTNRTSDEADEMCDGRTLNNAENDSETTINL